MSRRKYDAEWERRKSYLIRSMFCDEPEMSPIRESPELSASPPHSVESAFHEDNESLPDLIIERAPKRRSDDEPEEIYYELRKKMRKYYNMLFSKERNGSSCSEFAKKFVHSPTPSNKLTSDDDNFEPDFNIASVEDKTDNIELNKRIFSNNTDETNQLDQIQSVASRQSKSSDDDVNDESIPVSRKTKVEKENDQNLEKSKSPAFYVSIEENNKENIEIKRNLSQIDSESASVESLILPAFPSKKRHHNLLETNEKTKQSHRTKKLSFNEENNRLTLIQTENEDLEEETAAFLSEISKTIDNVKTVIAINESMLEKNLDDANINQNKKCLDSDNAEDKERSSKDTKNDIDKEQDNNQKNNNSTDKENLKDKVTKEIEKSKNEVNTLKVRQDDDKIVTDELEVMRGHNHSYTTQSIEPTSNSSSPRNIHFETRTYIISRHSEESDRQSMGFDNATRAMDVSEGTPEDFLPLFRCSSPITTDHFDVSNQRINSKRIHGIPSDEYIRRRAIVVRTDEREQTRTTAELIASVQHVPLTTKETENKVKVFREQACQTDDMITEKNKNVVDIGVQVQEKEKEVKSVKAQTDEDEGSFFVRYNMIFRRNYFIYL